MVLLLGGLFALCMCGGVCWSLADDIDNIVRGVCCMMEMSERRSGNDSSANLSIPSCPPWRWWGEWRVRSEMHGHRRSRVLLCG